MIINNELEFRDWFKKNYKKLGFSRIIKENKMSNINFWRIKK
jgi:hypothetical protein